MALAFWNCSALFVKKFNTPGKRIGLSGRDRTLALKKGGGGPSIFLLVGSKYMCLKISFIIQLILIFFQIVKKVEMGPVVNGLDLSSSRFFYTKL